MPSVFYYVRLQLLGRLFSKLDCPKCPFFWSKNALFWSEIHHMLSYSVVLYCIVFYCIVFYCIAWYIFCYLMVLHGIALYDLVSYVIYFVCILLRFSLRRTRRLFPPSTHLAQPTHPTHLDHLAQPTHPNQSTLLIWIIRLIQLNPPSGLLFVICHLSFVIWYFSFVICLFVICCIVAVSYTHLTLPTIA